VLKAVIFTHFRMSSETRLFASSYLSVRPSVGMYQRGSPPGRILLKFVIGALLGTYRCS